MGSSISDNFKPSEYFNIDIHGNKLVVDDVPCTPKEFIDQLKDILATSDTTSDPHAQELLRLCIQDAKKFEAEGKRIYYKAVSGEKERLTGAVSVRPYSNYRTGEMVIINALALQNPSSYIEEILTDMSAKTYFHGLPNRALADEQKYCVPHFVSVYEPYNLKAHFKKVLDGEEKLHINTYVVPEWRRVTPSENPDTLRLFKILMDNLFETERGRNFVGAWVHRAIFHRNLTYLMLRGVRGNGKTTFLQIIAELIGSPLKVQPNFFENKFDGALRGKRFVYKDEGDLNKKALGKIKEQLNRFVTLEEKFEKLGGHEEAFFSMAMAQNYEDRNYHLHDERKKAQPNLSSVKLKTLLTETEMEYLNYELLESPEDLAIIGNYIQEEFTPEKFPMWGPVSDFKESQFWDDVITAQPPFYQVLFTKILNKEADMYKLTDIAKEAETLRTTRRMKAEPPNTKTLINMSETFRWKDMDEPFFTIAGQGKVRYAIPHPDFLPDEIVEEDSFETELNI